MEILEVEGFFNEFGSQTDSVCAAVGTVKILFQFFTPIFDFGGIIARFLL